MKPEAKIEKITRNVFFDDLMDNLLLNLIM